MLEIEPVSLTKLAAVEILKIIKTKNIPADYSLRLGIRGAGCARVAPVIGFDKEKPTDLRYTSEGIAILVDKKHTLYLIGKKVDFYEGADAKGFLFVDPE